MKIHTMYEFSCRFEGKRPLNNMFCLRCVVEIKDVFYWSTNENIIVKNFYWRNLTIDEKYLKYRTAKENIGFFKQFWLAFPDLKPLYDGQLDNSHLDGDQLDDEQLRNANWTMNNRRIWKKYNNQVNFNYIKNTKNRQTYFAKHSIALFLLHFITQFIYYIELLP